jgi:tRNA dimethylallyltransferase
MHLTAEKPNITVICGPTGIGKTSTAIETAEAFGGQIISADSMQIYRHMDIGTAKPTPAERDRITHHLIDIVDPDEPFDAFQFSKAAHDKIFELHSHGTIPFVVGGTGLYIKALIDGLFRAQPVDPAVRKRIKAEAASKGPVLLHRRLKKIDRATAEKIHPNDIYRITRALEIFETTGQTISKHHQDHRFHDLSFRVLKIGLNMDRKALYRRIDRRVDDMIKAGWVEEVKGLLEKGYSADLKSMQAIGYRHIVQYLKGRWLWAETLRTLKRDTRRYAKRQLTWFRADPEIMWKEPKEIKDILASVKNFLGPQ